MGGWKKYYEHGKKERMREGMKEENAKGKKVERMKVLVSKKGRNMK